MYNILYAHAYVHVHIIYTYRLYVPPVRTLKDYIYTVLYAPCFYNLTSLIDVPSSPVLTYESTLNEILVSWSPVDSDTVCGPVTYNITVMPSHGIIMMINDTVYNITGLNYNTNYTITVYATNNAGDGGHTMLTVETKPLPRGAYKCHHIHSNYACTHICMYVMLSNCIHLPTHLYLRVCTYHYVLIKYSLLSYILAYTITLLHIIICMNVIYYSLTNNYMQ